MVWFLSIWMSLTGGANLVASRLSRDWRLAWYPQPGAWRWAAWAVTLPAPFAAVGYIAGLIGADAMLLVCIGGSGLWQLVTAGWKLWGGDDSAAPLDEV